jgi:hypothetical protein
MQAVFEISKPQLQELAQRVENGEEISTPQFVGVYRVKKIERKPYGAICFWTDLTPSGYTGIVKCPDNELKFNIWSHHQLENSWHLISED